MMGERIYIPYRISFILSFASLLFALVAPHSTFGQEASPDSTEIDLESVLEGLDAETQDPSALVDVLTTLASDPLDINSALEADLAQIPAFGPLLARAIVVFRSSEGDFGSLPELQLVPGITNEVYLAARPYLSIGASLNIEAPTPSPYPLRPSIGSMLGGLRYEIIQRVTRRLDLGRGYDDDTTRTTYVGTPERLYTRIRARYSRTLSINLTLEKDPGERFEWSPDQQTYGFDHVSGHVALRNYGRIQSLIIGDYEASFGQGIALWRSVALGKSRDVARPIARLGRGLTAYGSTNENQFFRGVAASIRISPQVTTSIFFSTRKLDATLTPTNLDSLDSFDVGISSFATSGLHRTPTESARKDQVDEQVIGAQLGWQQGRFQLGLAGYTSSFGNPLFPGTSAHERFDLQGDGLSVVSAYGQVYGYNTLLFGEIAYSNPKLGSNQIAASGGVLYRPSSALEAIIQGRYFPRDFVSIHGFTFGERGVPQNERGVYTGLSFRPTRSWSIRAYMDHYLFPWVQFAVPRPARGFDALLYAEHRPRRWLTVYVQARSETKEQSQRIQVEGDRILDGVGEETRQSIRLHGTYQFSNKLEVRARIEGVRFMAPQQTDLWGTILYQDVRWRPYSWLQVDTRLAFFETDSFEARVFAFEHDLLYTFAVPAFSGRGQRTYMLINVTPFSGFRVQMKAAVTYFEDVRSVGSGLDETNGNRLRDLRVQLQWQF